MWKMALENRRMAFSAPMRILHKTAPTLPATQHCHRKPPATPSRSHRRPSCTLLTPRTSSTFTKPQTITSEPLPDYPEWRFVGPPLSEGPLPTIIYFALSAQQSLELDPFNQFVTSIYPNPNLRILSVTLPFHSSNMVDNDNAFHRWADTYRAGGDIVSGFVRKVSASIDSMIASNIIRHDAAYVVGLSRGGLLASHVAVANASVRACLGFAPVTVLSDVGEFSDESVDGERAREKIRKASLLNDAVVEKLVDLPVRFYMGNFDRRVGTRNAFELVHLLAERAASRGVRSPPHEFIMYCSVGKQGHGTPPDVFQAGADYILDRIEEDRKKRGRMEGQ